MKIPDENKGPQINLKQHQRFKRVVPWVLIRKIVIVSLLLGMLYLVVNSLPSNHSVDDSGVEVQIQPS